MSFSISTPAPARLNRSQFFVLANKPGTFEAAARSVVDVVMFEIEDDVPPGEKPAARQNLIGSLNGIDWGQKSLSVRITRSGYWRCAARAALYGTIRRSRSSIAVPIQN